MDKYAPIYIAIAVLLLITVLAVGLQPDVININAGSGSNHNLFSSTHSDTVAGTATIGYLITGDNTNWIGLAPAASGTVLMSNGAGNAISWQTNPAGVTDHGLLTGLGDDDHPQYAISASYTGSGTIRNVGTIASGTWQGSTINPSYLGSGNYTSVAFLNGLGQFITSPATANYTYRDIVWFYASPTYAADPGVWIRLDEAGSSGDILGTYAVYASAATTLTTIDILKSSQADIDGSPSWTTIFSTKLTIDGNERSSNTALNPPVIGTTSWAANDHFRINMDGVGIGGANLTIKMKIRARIREN